MFAEVLTIVAAVVAGFVPMAIGIRRNQLTAAVMAGTFASGAVIQFPPLIALGATVGLAVVVALLPRRELQRRDANS